MTDRYRRGAERMEAEYVRNLERAKQQIEDELNGVDKKLDEEKAGTEKKDKDKSDTSGKKIVEEKAAKRNADDGNKTGSKRSAKKAVQEFAGDSTSESAAVKETPKQNYGGVIRVVVIDCSGDPAKAASARERLAGLGMSVTDGGSGNVREETLIVSTTTSGRVVTRLTEAPFIHGMSISRKDGADYDGIVYVGKDYK